jgi:hypothetical protein
MQNSAVYAREREAGVSAPEDEPNLIHISRAMPILRLAACWSRTLGRVR